MLQTAVIPPLATNARTGHPTFSDWEKRSKRVGHPPPSGAKPKAPAKAGAFFEIWIPTQRVVKNTMLQTVVIPALATNARTGHSTFSDWGKRSKRVCHPAPLRHSQW